VEPSLKKELLLEIGGHGLGGAAALLISSMFKSRGFKLGPVIAFGLPRMVPAQWLDPHQKENDQDKDSLLNLVRGVTEQDISVLRVVMHNDPAAEAFADCQHLGPELLLLPGLAYCYAANAREHSDPHGSSPDGTEEYRIDNYLRNLKPKIRGSPQRVPYAARHLEEQNQGTCVGTSSPATPRTNSLTSQKHTKKTAPH
jgi:hypothetical protein